MLTRVSLPARRETPAAARPGGPLKNRPVRVSWAHGFRIAENGIGTTTVDQDGPVLLEVSGTKMVSRTPSRVTESVPGDARPAAAKKIDWQAKSACGAGPATPGIIIGEPAGTTGLADAVLKPPAGLPASVAVLAAATIGGGAKEVVDDDGVPSSPAILRILDGRSPPLDPWLLFPTMGTDVSPPSSFSAAATMRRASKMDELVPARWLAVRFRLLTWSRGEARRESVVSPEPALSRPYEKDEAVYECSEARMIPGQASFDPDDDADEETDRFQVPLIIILYLPTVAGRADIMPSAAPPAAAAAPVASRLPLLAWRLFFFFFFLSLLARLFFLLLDLPAPLLLPRPLDDE